MLSATNNRTAWLMASKYGMKVNKAAAGRGAIRS
jgi:hypothetical protein